ncbi:DUF2183 domain-containing protein [Myxococcota bacterium]|nr:DUF2183 domain-containing protein [Myxococcota bacterium]MBU1428937.1 DUF2183 domain-containing protein [Myxococcota bacterium]MBU1896972.1 DUF2183 domain-containing protein [Myxococcota bacterium]
MTRALLICALCLGAARAKDPGRIVLYPGHGQAQGFTLSGRILEGRAPHARVEDGPARNLWRALKALESDEIKGATLALGVGQRAWRVRADDDGVFVLGVDGLDPGLSVGVHVVTAHVVEDRGHPTPPAEGALFILPPHGCALISDIDDTIVHTEVRSKRRMLKNTLLKNAAQLRPVAGAAAAYQRARAAGAVAVFYVSGSPQNLMERLMAFMSLRGFPAGPIMLKNIGRDPTFDQARYKLSHLREILRQHPGLKFTLIGDSGERDPEIYAQLKAEHPQAVHGILIRQAGGDLRPARFQGMTLFERFEGLPALCPPPPG